MNISWRSICKAGLGIGLIIGTVGTTVTAQRKKTPVTAKKAVVKAVPVTNQLLNDTCLYPFFDLLEAEDKDEISVLHLGDSHLQAGFFPGTVAAKLQEAFGDAGRGFVFPYTVAGTNGPDDYRWQSSSRWQAARVVERTNWYTGPGGIVLYSQQPLPELNFSFRGAGQTVSTASLLYEGGELPGINAKPIPMGEGRVLQQAEMKLPEGATSFNLRWSGLPDTRFYGAVVKNGEPGILYNTIGINGAMFSNYNNSDGALRLQCQWLDPKLVIISLGTNEAFGYMTPAQFRNEMDKMVVAIRRYSPDAVLLLTTPPNGMGKAIRTPYRKKVNGKYKTYYRSKFRTNTHVAVIRNEIVDYCKESGLACWDFYNIMKGDARFNRGWGSDHLHFNATGYNMQGAMLYEALDRSYKKYLNQSK